MKLKYIHEAANDGRLFRFTGKIKEVSYDNGNLKIDWLFPDAGKPFNLNHDFTYIELAPKYDPCRKFRRGDIVRYVPHNGRECPAMPLDEYYRVKTLTVVEDEDANHRVLVETQDGRNKYIMFCYLELVTPVEELEPFEVYHRPSEWCVIKTANDLIASIYNVDIHPNAKAAAEAERDRLNAEWRKEMEK
jgi:hypothetical protein